MINCLISLCVIGGVLVERTVKDALTALVNNRQQVRILCTARGGAQYTAGGRCLTI